MRKKDTINCYISGVNKLPVRENPFADTDTDDSAADSTRDITPSAAYVRPRYGAYIVAAVLIVCVSAGAVFIGNRALKEDNSSWESVVSYEHETMIIHVDLIRYYFLTEQLTFEYEGRKYTLSYNWDKILNDFPDTDKGLDLMNILSNSPYTPVPADIEITADMTEIIALKYIY